MQKLELNEFPAWDNDRIKETLLNRAEVNIISLIMDTRNDIQSIINIVGDEEFGSGQNLYRSGAGGTEGRCRSFPFFPDLTDLRMISPI